MLAVQVLERARAGIGPAENDPFEGRPDLFAEIANAGPVTAAGLATSTDLSRFAAAGWLARRAAEGYLHRDAGRYAPWCPWPRPGATALTPNTERRWSGSLKRIVARAQQRMLDAMAMTWFGLMGDHEFWSADETGNWLVPPAREDRGRTAGGGR